MAWLSRTRQRAATISLRCKAAAVRWQLKQMHQRVQMQHVAVHNRRSCLRQLAIRWLAGKQRAVKGARSHRWQHDQCSRQRGAHAWSSARRVLDGADDTTGTAMRTLLRAFVSSV